MNHGSMAMAGGSFPPGESFSGTNNPCILGLTNGTYPNGTVGMGSWVFGNYMPSGMEKTACQNAEGPWTVSPKYGLWTTYFIIAGFVVVGLVNALKSFNGLVHSHNSKSFLRIPAKLSAFFRAGSYPRAVSWLPSLGPSLWTLAFAIFSLVISFGIKPYYRPPNYGSSPLGLRTEWIATAMVVWIYATGTKFNPLSYLSGISTKRLMSLHKIAPWICLFLSCAHTGAMIVRANKQQPWSYTWATNEAYGWKAWAPLAALAWLCLMSLGPVRKVCYEFFYIFHMIGALFFIVGMYLHLDDLLKSWDYMHPAVVVFALAIFWRMGATTWFHRFFTSIPRASVEQLSGHGLKISVPLPHSRSWTPGQHVYIRLLTMHAWETHPFTISSLPAVTDSSNNSMDFIIRPMTGLSGRLHRFATSTQTLPVLIDGPYGSLGTMPSCQNLLFIVGGVGMSYVAPVLTAFARHFSNKTPSTFLTACTSIEVVWTFRNEETLDWYKEYIDEAFEIASEQIKITMHCTSKGLESSKSSVDMEKGSRSPSLGAQSFMGTRPDVFGIIAEAVVNQSGRLGVVTCGPDSLLLDARNAVAKAQISILKGHAKVSEVELHEESFEY